MAAKDVSRIQVVLPAADQVPPLIFRATTGPRRLRSAALLNLGERGGRTKSPDASFLSSVVATADARRWTRIESGQLELFPDLL